MTLIRFTQEIWKYLLLPVTTETRCIFPHSMRKTAFGEPVVFGMLVAWR